MRPMGFSRESLIGLIVVIPWTFLIWQGHERNQHPEPFYDFTVTISALILALLIETIIRVHKVSSNVESIRRQGEDATRRLVLLCYKGTNSYRIVLWVDTPRQAHRRNALRHIWMAWRKPRGTLIGQRR